MKNQLTTAQDYSARIRKTAYLVPDLWKEHTLLLLHAPREIDKTDKALEIIEKVATFGRKMVYVNIARNLDPYAGRIDAVDDLYILTPGFENAYIPTDYADIVIAAIEEAVASTGSRIFVIDSVSHIAALSFGRNASPAYIMKRLAVLRLRYGLSFLVIADDTTRSANQALLNLSDADISLSEAPSEKSAPSKKSERSEKSVLSGFHDRPGGSAFFPPRDELVLASEYHRRP